MAGGQTGGEAAAFALDPATGLIAAIALAVMLTAFALAHRPLPTRIDPPGRRGGRLEDLFDRDHFARELRRMDRRKPPAPRNAVVAARIDHLPVVAPVRGGDARREALEEAARVMRAGLRRGDAVHTIPGEGFVIVLGGAREAEAAGIARRLRRALGRIRVPGLGGALRFSMSFGVAEARMGESAEAARARATSALDEAMAGGAEDCVVLASEIEEVLFLPPPSASRAA